MKIIGKSFGLLEKKPSLRIILESIFDFNRDKDSFGFKNQILISIIRKEMSSILHKQFFKELQIDKNEIVGASTLSILTLKEIFQKESNKSFFFQKCHRP